MSYHTDNNFLNSAPGASKHITKRKKPSSIVERFMVIEHGYIALSAKAIIIVGVIAMGLAIFWALFYSCVWAGSVQCEWFGEWPTISETVAHPGSCKTYTFATAFMSLTALQVNMRCFIKMFLDWGVRKWIVVIYGIVTTISIIAPLGLPIYDTYADQDIHTMLAKTTFQSTGVSAFIVIVLQLYHRKKMSPKARVANKI